MPLLPQGSTLGVDDGSTGYDLIGGVDNLNIDLGQSDEIDTTDWDSEGIEEIIGGIVRGGNATFSTNADPEAAGTPTSNYDKLVTLHASQAVKEWQLIIKSGSTTVATATFDAFVKGLTQSVPATDKLVTNVTLRITGAITWS